MSHSGFCLLLCSLLVSCDATRQDSAQVESANTSPANTSPAETIVDDSSIAPLPNSNPVADESNAEWQSLFNHKDLTGWKPTNFGGEGDVAIKNGEMRFDLGYPMTGVTWTVDQDKDVSLPTTDYEISLEAKKLDGNDFFCGLTFPVNDSHCSLIVGGWGGTLVGLSCIDGEDASNNDTKLHQNFANDRWYKIRVLVSGDRIRVVIDDKSVIDRDISSSEVSVRDEVMLSRPFGICCFDTQASFRQIKVRRIKKK